VRILRTIEEGLHGEFGAQDAHPTLAMSHNQPLAVERQLRDKPNITSIPV
jgi:hypothetical protein